MQVAIKKKNMKNYLLQHGNYGEGPINPFLVSTSKNDLIGKVKSIIPADCINSINTYFDSGDCVHIRLTKPFEYSGFTYNMFFIDAIEAI